VARRADGCAAFVDGRRLDLAATEETHSELVERGAPVVGHARTRRGRRDLLRRRSHSSAGQGSAADFIRQVTTQFSRGQSGPLWDALHPVDQAVVTRARYMGCKSNSGFDLTKFKVLQTYPDTIDIAGTATPSTAVSVRVAADDGITTATMHAVRIEGTWRWVLSQADYTAYKHGKCPSS
jgi:hypothetical protein